MEKNQGRVIEALQYAIKMELDGRKYYTDCASKADNRTGKELFTWLASQEDNHRSRFKEIYDTLMSKNNWPAVDIKPAKRHNLTTLFSSAIKETGTAVKAGAEHADAVSRSMQLEIESRDFYRAQAKQAQSSTEKSFYDLIAGEEEGHYLALVDYKEYIEDPEDWFTKTEHHSMDGA